VLKSTYDIGQIVAKGKDETQMYITDIGDAYIHELAIILIKNGKHSNIPVVKKERRRAATISSVRKRGTSKFLSPLL
jgi:CRISPR-associated protein Csh1